LRAAGCLFLPFLRPLEPVNKEPELEHRELAYPFEAVAELVCD